MFMWTSAWAREEGGAHRKGHNWSRSGSSRRATNAREQTHFNRQQKGRRRAELAGPNVGMAWCVRPMLQVSKNLEVLRKLMIWIMTQICSIH